MDFKLQTDLNTLPSVIEFNYSELKAEMTERLKYVEGRALAAHFNPVFGHKLRVNLLAYRRNNKVTWKFKRFAGGDGAAAAGCVRFAKLHLIADQLAVLLLDRRRQFDQRCV